MMQSLGARIQKTFKDRNPSIDFLRGLSILTVVMLHFGMYYHSEFPAAPRLFSLAYWGYISRNGYLGVSIFFVISGYLITTRALMRYKKLSKVNFFGFYVFRFARIVPPLFLLVLVNVALHFLNEPGFIISNTEKFSAWELFVGAITLRLNFYWEPAVTGLGLAVLWSLAIEEAFYVLFPILSRALRKTMFIVGAFAGLMIYAVVYRYQTGYPESFFGYFSCLDLLAFGCVLAIFKSSFPQIALVLEKKWLNGLSLIALIVFYLSHYDREWEVWGSAILGPIVGLFLLSAESRENSKSYSGKFSIVMRVMGIYSYEIYLFHFVVIQLMTHYLFPILNEIEFFRGAVDIFFLFAWVGTMAFSILLAEYFSEPAREMVKRFA